MTIQQSPGHLSAFYVKFRYSEDLLIAELAL